MKKLTLFVFACFSTAMVMAQAPAKKMDQLSKDPAQATEAAKADVFIADSKQIFDRTTLGNKPVVKGTSNQKKTCRKKKQ
ncbi:hypothetical protein [Aridibaculum aurantiacum]|uniref:hypothetical protein n=1 Tax=Aridibaculum aurantiacum TaxID=2810307 RepID=UPI001A969E87|nr:hypothetical protein [Aridibaculum aurantiacum]